MHLILFDIDGTLVNGQGMGRLAMERAFAETFGRESEDHPRVREVHFAGSTDRVIIEDMARALDIPDAEFVRRREELDRAFYRHLRVTVAESEGKIPCPGVLELLPRLAADRRFVLALVTGNLEQGARIKLEPFGLNRFFAFGGFGSDATDRSDLARLARERAEEASGTRFAPGDVVLVGDTVSDMKAARANGFLAAGVTTGWADADDLTQAGADVVFADLTPEGGFERWLAGAWNLAEPDPV